MVSFQHSFHEICPFLFVDGLIKAGLDSFTAQQGDMILRYEDVPLYSSRDLRSATTQVNETNWLR